MPADTFEAVMKAEQEADNRIAAASAEARKLTAEAEVQGQQAFLDAEAEAEDTVETLMIESQRKAAEAALEISIRTANDCQMLRSAAHNRMPEAIRLVVERIVNG